MDQDENAFTTPDGSDAAPPTQAGDFVPVTPPEGWPTVVGVLAIIFGALGTAGGACNIVVVLLFGLFFSVLPPEMQEQLKDQAATSAPHPVAQIAVGLFEFVLAIVLLAGGIMLVRRRSRAGGVLTMYAWLDLLANTAGAVLGYFVAAAALAHMQENPQMQQAGAVAGIMQKLGVVWIFIAWCGAAIWPVFLIIWFRREKIRASMRAWG